MKTFAKINLLLILVLLLAACQPTNPPAEPVETTAPAEPTAAPVEPTAAPEPSFDLTGTAWVLATLNGNEPLEGTTLTLRFGADGSASGTDGCNRFSTTFTQDGANLTIRLGQGQDLDQGVTLSGVALQNLNSCRDLVNLVEQLHALRDNHPAPLKAIA